MIQEHAEVHEFFFRDNALRSASYTDGNQTSNTDDIGFSYLHVVQVLHSLHPLVDFRLQRNNITIEISARFQSHSYVL